jgi:protein SCO1/2
MLLAACRSNSGPSSRQSSRSVNQSHDRLEAIALTDQYGRTVLLDSLKGKFALVDFIYTSCPGPCLLTTGRLAGVANKLGDAIGSRLTLVSITVDPEHDGPAQLLDYSKRVGADRPGWLFLTGSAPKIEQVLKDFNLPRQREPDGVIDHILYFFLIGVDGHEVALYDPFRASPDAIAMAIKQALARGSLNQVDPATGV